MPIRFSLCFINKNTAHRQQGFSTLELVLIAIIIAIALGFYLRESTSLREVAHREVLNTHHRSFQTAVFFVWVSTELDRKSAASDDIYSFGAGNVDVNEFGFPVDTEGANEIAGNAQRCINVWNGIMENAPLVSLDRRQGSVYQVYAEDEICYFDYLLDDEVSRAFSYNATSGVVEIKSLQDK